MRHIRTAFLWEKAYILHSPLLTSWTAVAHVNQGSPTYDGLLQYSACLMKDDDVLTDTGELQRTIYQQFCRTFLKNGKRFSRLESRLCVNYVSVFIKS